MSENKIADEVYNKLRLEFKKGESLKYVKELCSHIPLEQMGKFTSIAMKCAYDAKRSKALDYMLSLEGRNEAFLLVKIHTQIMMFNENELEKGAKILAVICKHFKRVEILKELDKCLQYKINDPKVSPRHKELSFMVYNNTLEEKNIKTKLNKI